MPAVLGILLAGLLSAARTALLAVEEPEIRARVKEGKAWAARVLGLLEHPERIFSTCRLGVELCLVGGSAWVLITVWKGWGWAWGGLASIGFLLAFLVLGEILPQALAAKRPSAWIGVMSWGMALGRWVLFPWILMERAGLSLGAEGGERTGQGESSQVTRQALSWLIRGEEKEREILREERQMIDRIFRFSETQVREVMIPLIEVSAIDETATVEEVIRKVQEEGYSRFPVYRERIDHVLGILRSFDLLGASAAEPASSFTRKAPFVPEVMPVDELMLQLQRDGHHMAIVVDEYGGTDGLVTIEDLLEEIVGEIQDEHDREEAQIERLADGSVIFNGRVTLDEVNELLALELTGEDVATIGGFVSVQLGKIPVRGDRLEVPGATIEVVATAARRARKVKISRHSKEPEAREMEGS